MSIVKLVTKKEVRFSYLNVFEPRAIVEGGEPKYSVSVLIPKTDKELIGEIQQAVDKAMELAKDPIFGGKMPARWASPLRDGDVDKPDHEEYQGMMFFNCTTKNRPGIVDNDMQPILDPSEFASGDYGRVSVNFRAYSQAGNKGVGVYLNNIQKTKSGERFVAGATAEDDFGGLGDGAEELF